jgi:hypothetical protein
VANSQYTLEQLYNLAVEAGWPEQVAPWAAATAMVESSGDPTAASGTGPVGLWQINRGNAQHLGYSLDDRLDPLKNAQMALQLWKNRGGENVPPETAFADWWPYDRNTSGKDEAFNKLLDQAKTFRPTKGLWNTLGDATDNLNPLTALGKLTDQFIGFAKIMAWFVNPANDIRVLLGIFGLAFLGGGVWMLGREVRRG